MLGADTGAIFEGSSIRDAQLDWPKFFDPTFIEQVTMLAPCVAAATTNVHAHVAITMHRNVDTM